MTRRGLAPAGAGMGDLLAGMSSNMLLIAWLHDITAEATRRCKTRRARVLRHDDLAARLCAAPLNFASPEQWTGYVPPRYGAEQLREPVHGPADWTQSAAWAVGGRPNEAGHVTESTDTSEQAERAALVAICAEALARDIRDGLVTEPDPPVLAVHPFPGMFTTPPPPPGTFLRDDPGDSDGPHADLGGGIR